MSRKKRPELKVAFETVGRCCLQLHGEKSNLDLAMSVEGGINASIREIIAVGCSVAMKLKRSESPAQFRSIL